MAEFLYHLPISDLRILRLYFILSRNLLVAGGGPTTTALKLLEEWNKSVNNGTKIKYYVVISVKVHFICFFYFKPKNFHSVPHREYFLLRGHAHCSPVEWKMKSEKYPTSAKRWCCKSSQLCVHLFVCLCVSWKVANDEAFRCSQMHTVLTRFSLPVRCDGWKTDKDCDKVRRPECRKMHPSP